jgi:hypothetical protein
MNPLSITLNFFFGLITSILITSGIVIITGYDITPKPEIGIIFVFLVIFIYMACIIIIYTKGLHKGFFESYVLEDDDEKHLLEKVPKKIIVYFIGFISGILLYIGVIFFTYTKIEVGDDIAGFILLCSGTLILLLFILLTFVKKFYKNN